MTDLRSDSCVEEVPVNESSFVILINGKLYGMHEHNLNANDIRRLGNIPKGDEIWHIFTTSNVKPKKWKMIEGVPDYTYDMDEFQSVPLMGGVG